MFYSLNLTVRDYFKRVSQFFNTYYLKRDLIYNIFYTSCHIVTTIRMIYATTNPASLHVWIQLLAKMNLSDNVPNWFNFDSYMCNVIKVGCQPHLTGLHKLYKICFLYTFYEPVEKAVNIWYFTPTSLFYIIFTDDLSIWTYPIYNSIFKYNQNLSSYQQQNYTRVILCHNCTLLLNNAPISLVENES